MSSKTLWSTQRTPGQPGLHSETLSQKLQQEIICSPAHLYYPKTYVKPWAFCVINPCSLADPEAQKSKDFRYVICSMIGRSSVCTRNQWDKERIASNTNWSPQISISSYLTSLQLVPHQTSICWANNHLNSGTCPQYLRMEDTST